jgi:hypothetical protein
MADSQPPLLPVGLLPIGWHWWMSAHAHRYWGSQDSRNLLDQTEFWYQKEGGGVYTSITKFNVLITT